VAVVECARRPSQERSGVAVGLGRCRGCPAETRELASRGDGDQGGVFAAFAQPLVDAVEPVLGAPGDLEDVIGLAVLAVSQRRADAGWPLVVPGRLDQQTARVA
jgi:hypothetical protein